MAFCILGISFTLAINVALSAGALEYTDWFSAEGLDPPTSVLDMTLNNFRKKFQ